MTTIREIATELGMQPYQVAEFLNLGRDYRDDDEISAEDEHILRWTDDGVYVEPEAPRVVEVYGGKFQVQFNVAPHTWSYANVPAFDTREQAGAFAAKSH